MVLIAVLILAVLLVIAALGYLFFFKNSTSGHQAQPPLTTGVQATEEATGDEDEAPTAGEATAEMTSPEKTRSVTSEKRPEYPDLPSGVSLLTPPPATTNRAETLTAYTAVPRLPPRPLPTSCAMNT